MDDADGPSSDAESYKPGLTIRNWHVVVAGETNTAAASPLINGHTVFVGDEFYQLA